MPSATVNYYSNIAADFHASYQKDPNRLERVQVWKRFLDIYASSVKNAYDIGCGSGVMACELAERGIETVGIDGAAGMLEIAEEMAKERGLQNIRFEQHYLPVSDTSNFQPAHLVLASSAIEYMNCIAESLQFINALLNRDGIVIFSVSNRDSVSRKLVRIIYKLTGRPNYFGLLKHFMTVSGIQAILQQTGFEFLESAYFGKADKINQKLGRFLPIHYSSNMIIVAARKK